MSLHELTAGLMKINALNLTESALFLRTDTILKILLLEEAKMHKFVITYPPLEILSVF